VQAPPPPLSPEIVAAILKSDAVYLNAAFDAIEQKHGSVAAYLEDALGVNAEARDAIRQRLLE
jgi:protein-tyrosine phosphatase